MTNEQIAAKLDALVLLIEENKKDIRTTREILTGNGDPTRGLIVQFDRVKQGWVGQKKFAGTLAIAAITGFLSFLGSLILLAIRLAWGL